MLKSKLAPTARLTVADAVGRKVTLGPLACPHCAHGVCAPARTRYT